MSIPLVEDAAEALGSKIGKVHVGLFGDVGSISFNGNKIITTGGGGAVITNNGQIAKKLRHSQQPLKFHIRSIISTTSQLQLPHAWDKCCIRFRSARNVAQTIAAKGGIVLNDYRNIRAHQHTIKADHGCSSNNWLISIMTESKSDKTELLHHLHDFGIAARPLWKPLITLKHLRILKLVIN